MDKISGTAIWVQAEACGLGSMLRAGSSIAYHLFRLRYFVLIKVMPSGGTLFAGVSILGLVCESTRECYIATRVFLLFFKFSLYYVSCC